MLIGLGHDLQRSTEIDPTGELGAPGVFFTVRERERWEGAASPRQSMAAIFSAKEALFKALPAMQGHPWCDAEVVHDRHGAPRFELHGALGQLVRGQGWAIQLSLSHSGDYVSAVVAVSETGAPPGSEARGDGEGDGGGDGLLDQEIELDLHVRPNDLDALGHVNNATALEYLEAGRQAWLRATRCRVSGTIVPVVSRIDVQYRAEIRSHRVRVRTALDEPSRQALADGPTYRSSFRQSIWAERDGKPVLAVEARVDVAFIDREAGELCTAQDFLDPDDNGRNEIMAQRALGGAPAPGAGTSP
jgi:phosphopantetheine--protein transferase-like protein